VSNYVVHGYRENIFEEGKIGRGERGRIEEG
jgi:hypothetical protein